MCSTISIRAINKVKCLNNSLKCTVILDLKFLENHFNFNIVCNLYTRMLS